MSGLLLSTWFTGKQNLSQIYWPSSLLKKFNVTGCSYKLGLVKIFGCLSYISGQNQLRPYSNNTSRAGIV